MSNNTIWIIDKTLSSASILGQSRLGSDGNDGLLCISQSSSVTGTLSSDCLMLYQEHSLGESYFSTKMQSVYSAAPAEWVSYLC